MPRRQLRPDPPAPLAEAQVYTLLAETQALSARLAALNELATAMQSRLDRRGLLDTLAREARWVLDFGHCALVERSGAAYVEHILTPPGAPPRLRAGLEGSPAGQAIGSGQAMLLNDCAGRDGVPDAMGAGLIVPLRGQGEVFGCLSFYAAAGKRYSLDDLRIAGALAAQAAVLIQNARLFQEATEARDELHTVLESINDGVIVVGPSGVVLLLNRAARLMAGLPARPLLGLSLARLALMARAQGQRRLGPAQIRALGAELARQDHGTVRTRDGQYIEWTRAPLGQTAEQVAYVLTLHDVTDRVRLDELRDDMVAMLVHDLRTPLSAMMLSVDMLDYVSEDDTRKELMSRARQNVRQMLRKVNTLLDLRKLEAGQLTVERRPYPIVVISAEVVESFRGVATMQQLQLAHRAPPDIPDILIDVDLITRVLENLVGNALKFTPEGGAVAVELAHDAAGVTLQIRDSGPGVPAELRERIFEKYVQVRGGAERKGSGLGLAFSRMVVEAHGGDIGVRDNPGGGSIFWLRLPAA